MLKPISDGINKYFLPIILIIGTIGNCLSFLVLSRATIAKSNLSVYFRVLAICDTITLIIGLFPEFLHQISYFRLSTISDWTCRFQRFCNFFFGDIACWTLVLVSLERLIAVVWPLKAKIWCSKTRALCYSAVLILPASLKNFMIFLTLELRVISRITISNKTFGEVRKCVSKIEYSYYENLVRPILSLVLYYLVTASAIFITNAIIRYFMKVRIRTILRTNTEVGTDASKSQRHQSRSLLKMSMCIGILYIIFLTPSMIIWTLISLFFFWNRYMNPALVDLLFSITNILAYLQYSTNFFVYVISGRRFRKELKNLLKFQF